jgi:PadR family transcriptional regulator PadR
MVVEWWDEELSEEEKKLNKNIMKHINNGLYRTIILWEVNKSPIHGYGIMKKIDLFYKNQIDDGFINKSSPSKIYPILQKMEEIELIKGYWDINNNKKVKFYEITPKGVKTLNHIKLKFHDVGSNPIWKDFIHEMIIDPINDESINKEDEVKE